MLQECCVRAPAAHTLTAYVNDEHVEEYTRPDSIWAALESRDVLLVRSSWMIMRSKEGRPLPRRQELPPEAFISLEELQAMTARAATCCA